MIECKNNELNLMTLPAGFKNGKEKDDEVKGSGNSLDFGARIYDSRLGRWLSLDPLQRKHAAMGPYIYSGNSPIAFLDPDGKDIKPSALFMSSKWGLVY